LRHGAGAGAPFLEFLWNHCEPGEVLTAPRLAEVMEEAAKALEAAAAAGIVPVALFDSRYPPLLACTVDPPPVLWIRGSPAALANPTIAVIGSRAATPYALQVGSRIAAELASRGVAVVSGLARGVDSSAHRGCLQQGGVTIAVLGCGVDRVYPPEHGDLASQIAATGGAVVAELEPGTPPLPGHFPLRNRIISGISLATVVVEASEHSGSLITARCAVEQGRDVMVVPGSVLSGRNRGSHALLRDGARVVESADDILEELGWPAAAARVAPPKPLSADPVLERMQPGEAYGLDDLATLTGWGGPKLLVRLTELEIAGRLTMSRGRYMRSA
jgi:DNA processing protein